MEEFNWIKFKYDNNSLLRAIKVFITIILIAFSISQGTLMYLEKYIDPVFCFIVKVITDSLLSILLMQGVLSMINNYIANKGYPFYGLFHNVPWKNAAIIQLSYYLYYYTNDYFTKNINIVNIEKEYRIIIAFALLFFLIVFFVLCIKLSLAEVIFRKNPSFVESLIQSWRITGKEYIKGLVKIIVIPYSIILIMSLAFDALMRSNPFTGVDDSIIWGVKRFITHFTVYVLVGYYPKYIYYLYKYASTHGINNLKRK